MPNSPYDELPRILVVDDEEAIREILADFLSLEGFYIGTAKDGKDALEELSRSHYDIVLSDLKMPNMGLTTTSSICRQWTSNMASPSSSPAT